MGRYYSGDIDGKFWFGVQNSNDADFFGSTGYEPNYLEYSFEKEEHLESVKDGIAQCEKEIGNREEQWEQFCKDEDNYNDTILKKYWKEKYNEELSNKPRKDLKLEWIARVRLGRKILKCLEEYGTCGFQAEL